MLLCVSFIFGADSPSEIRYARTWRNGGRWQLCQLEIFRNYSRMGFWLGIGY